MILGKNWLTQGLIDFEYKQYLLLAYFQEIKKKFNSIELYPYLSDLVFHYQNLLALKNNKEVLFKEFPKQISKADFDSLKIHYEKIVQDDELMKELEDIVLYALPQFKQMLDEGKDIYEHIEEHIQISTVGIAALRTDEGYMFLNTEEQRDMLVYEYKLTFFENAQEKFRAIHTQFLGSIAKTIGKTFENMKVELIKKYKKMPNPATYLVNSKIICPTQATLLPIAKRLLVRHIATEG